MNNRITQIQCVNRKCKTLNKVEDELCNRCSTPVVKNYLWIKGQGIQEYKVGELIDDRFLLCYPNIVLDTKPDILTDTPENIPDEIKSYLKLFSYRLHLPQVYGYLNFPEQIWLLEYESVPISSEGRLIYPKFFPSIESSFPQVSALRQMSWLWQIVQLWEPLGKQKVLSSLFLPNNICVNGSIVKLIELQFEEELSPTLQDLGDLWYIWLPNFDPLVQVILKKIILSLQQNLFVEIDDLVEILDQVISILGNNFYERQFQVITLTDPGKKRSTNEDSCYPAVDNLKQTKKELETLSIVCDGLGGQEGGEVASGIAIDIIHKSLKVSYQKALKETINYKYWTPLIDATKIYQAISKANNKITNLNNAQKRERRQRMGTTANVGMAIAHEVYLANVGDSRIYWITPQSCHQVSVDDDIATKKVKKGKGLYRLISANPKAGVLLQALGMDVSSKLKVHIRRFTIDEDSIFLLCSDGLSDFERVEQYWQSEILPVIQKKKTLKDAAESLMDIGINKNGHDNVTVALLYCQVKLRKKPEQAKKLSWKYLQEILPDLPQPQEQPYWLVKLTLFKEMILTQNTMIIAKQKIILITILIVGSGIGLWFWLKYKSSENKSSYEQSSISNKPFQEYFSVNKTILIQQRVNL